MTSTLYSTTAGIVVDPDPATTATAIFAIGYEVTRPARSVVHEVPNTLSPPVTFKEAGPRSGTIEYLFADREQCRRAEVIHAEASYIMLEDADWPDSPMRYVAQDEIVSTLDPETRTRWILSTGFTEVKP